MKITISDMESENRESYRLVCNGSPGNISQEERDEILEAAARMLEDIDPIMPSPSEYWQVWRCFYRNDDNEFEHRIEMYRQPPDQDNKVVMVLHTTTNSSEARLVCSILKDVFSAFYAGDDV